MKIKAMEHSGVVVLRLTGHMDMGQIGSLKDAIAEHRQTGIRYFILNMIDVTNLSSSGIQQVLAVYRELEMGGGRLVLAELSAVAEYVLDLAGLKDGLPVYEREEDALDVLQVR